MSFTRGPFPGSGGLGSLGGRTQDRLNRAEEGLAQHDLIDQGDDGISEAPRKRGITDRLRSLLRRDDSSAVPAAPDVPDADVWARERQRRRQLDQDRPNDT